MSKFFAKINGLFSPEFKAKIKRLLFCTLMGKEPVHFLHISKTGGTALQVALHKHTVTKKYALEFHPHRVRLRDIPAGEKVIFFLRDPVTRFVSGFYTRLRCGQPRNYTPWSPKEEEAFKKFDTPNKLALALGSDDLEVQQSAVKAMQSIGHVNKTFLDWFESEAYFTSRLEDVFFIGFQETFNVDFGRLKAKLGTPEKVHLPTDDVQAHKAPRGLDTSLDEKAVENIKAWYTQDYAFIDLCRRIRSENQ